MDKSLVKLQVTIGGAMRKFLEELAEKKFEGNMSWAVEACIDYTMSQYLHDRQSLTELYFDMPPYHESRDTREMQSGVIDKKKFTFFLNPSQIAAMDTLAKHTSSYETHKGKKVITYTYPQFRGLKRNVLYQCVYNLMYDMALFSLNSFKL